MRHLILAGLVLLVALSARAQPTAGCLLSWPPAQVVVDGILYWCSAPNTWTQVGGGGGSAWGGITGTLSAQADLQAALDGKTATGHAHVAGDVTGTAVLTADARLSDARTPTVHATSHKTGGSDPIALDTLAAPTDVTTLNVSTTAHGLTPKLSNIATQYLSGAGTWTVPAGGPTTLISTTLQSDAVIATYTPITGLAFTPLAATNYLMDCFIRYTSTAATTGINFAWDVPAAVTAIHMSGFTTTTALGANEGFSQRADNVGSSTSASVITVQNTAVLHAQLQNGANATSTTLGFTPETANAVSVIAGSVCQIRSY